MASRKKTGIKNRDASKIPDHWAFLEEIEAPMWADLEMETQGIREESDDSWFQATHPVHQMSSRRLKSSIVHIPIQDEPEKPETFSRTPCLPVSVSISRGKYYSAKRIVGRQLELSSCERHPIRNFSSSNAKSAVNILSKDLDMKKSPSLTTENVNFNSTTRQFPNKEMKNKTRVYEYECEKTLKASSSSRVRKPLRVLNGANHTKKAAEQIASITKNSREEKPSKHGDPHVKGKKTSGARMATVAAKYLR